MSRSIKNLDKKLEVIGKIRNLFEDNKLVGILENPHKIKFSQNAFFTAYELEKIF